MLLQSLLQWSQSQMTDQPSRTEMLPIKQLFDQQFNLFELQARRKDIRLQSSLHPIHLTALGDRNILETILRNLISNAIKFSKQGTVIKLEAVLENGQVAIYVTDEGIGMTPAQIQDIYDLKAKNTRGPTKK